MLANGGWDLTLIPLTWTIWRAPTNASKWRMGFNTAFKGLKINSLTNIYFLENKNLLILQKEEMSYVYTVGGSGLA